MTSIATGSTGNPIQDGLTRAGWVAAVQAFLAFTVLKWEWLTNEELAVLEVPITFVAVALWGLFDFLRRRVDQPH
jgi:hypothetical protein